MAVFTGAIKNWNPDKGWGFIVSDQTQQIYGKDIFVMRSAMPANANVNRGDTVSFTVQQGTKGPEAANVNFLGGGAFAGVPGVPVAASAMMAPPRPAMSAKPPATPGFASALTGVAPGAAGAGMFIGSVKSWNPQKGWGFIQCQQTQQIYAKDIFVMKSAVVSGENLTPGAVVRFSVETGLKGVQATNVIAALGAPGSLGGCFGGGLGGGPGGGAPAHSPRPPPGNTTDQVHFGMVKAFNEGKGWGHIDCAATRKLFDKDIFMMRSSLNGQFASQGSLVSFKVVMGMKGPEATDVRVLPPGSFSLNGVEGSIFLGRIKNYNKDKGWGFISGDEVRSTFDKDIFVHRRELQGWEPSDGEEVRFSVVINVNGRPEAATVSLGGDPGAEARSPSAFEAPGYSPY